MDQKGIDRINELARKAKTQENINIQEKDGSITNLGEKYGSKESH